MKGNITPPRCFRHPQSKPSDIGLALAESNGFDLLSLDVMLPGFTGFDIARQLRAGGDQTPFLMLTARDAPRDVVNGLDLGADDYLTKPFSFEILLARVRALGRRGPIAQPVVLRTAGISLHLGTREVRRGGRKIELTRTDYAILELLMRNADRVLTREALIERVWGGDSNIENNTLDAFVRLLRAKVESRRRAARDPHGPRRRLLPAAGGGLMRLSIRQRLTAWYVAALLLGLSVFAFSMWISLRKRLIAGVDARLAQRIQGLQTAVGADAEIRDRAQLLQELDEFLREVPDSSIVQLRDSAGAILSPAKGQPILLPVFGGPAPYTDTLSGHPFRIATTRFESAGSVFDAQVAIQLDETLGVMCSFRELLLFLIPAVLIVSCLGGYWLSSRALRPVDEITSVARYIGVQNLSQRVVVP